jgi:hypothetical protein
MVKPFVRRTILTVLAPGPSIAEKNPFQPFIEGLIHRFAHQLAGIVAQRVQAALEKLEVARTAGTQLVDRQQPYLLIGRLLLSNRLALALGALCEDLVPISRISTSFCHLHLSLVLAQDGPPC